MSDSFRSQPMWCFALVFASLAAADVFSGRLLYAPGIRRAADGSVEHFSLHTFRASSDGVHGLTCVPPRPPALSSSSSSGSGVWAWWRFGWLAVRRPRPSCCGSCSPSSVSSRERREVEAQLLVSSDRARRCPRLDRTGRPLLLSSAAGRLAVCAAAAEAM